MAYPILYEQNATDFFNLGLGVIITATQAQVFEERNGVYYTELTVLIDDTVFPLLTYNRIIKCDAGHKAKEQRFRIKKITPNSNGTALIYAEHISYVAVELALKPEVIIIGNCGVVLDQWQKSIIGTNPLTTQTDINTESQVKWTIENIENARQALGGVQGSILDIFGGEYEFDNYKVILHKKRGKSADTLLAYGRNIIDIEQEKNISNTYTSIYPYVVYQDEDQKDVLVTIDGYVLDIDTIDSYPNRNVKIVNFSSEFDDGETITKDKLKAKAEAYMKANEFGVPKVSIKVSFLDLSNTLDYKDMAPLEELNLCDDVTIKYPLLGVDTTAKVVRTVWNVITESYDEVEIGEKRTSLSGIINDTQQQAQNAENTANNSLTSANGKNTIFYGPDEPKANKVGDIWYKPVGDETEMYVWDGSEWTFILSTKDNALLQEQIEQLDKDLAEEKENIQEAISKANEAADLAGENMESLLEFQDETTGQVTEIKGSIEGLQTSVADKASQSQVTQLSNQITSIVTDIEGYSSDITQLSNQINLMVEKDDIINQINISDKGILISGSKITIDGDTYIANGIIKNAHIEDLNATKITAGTLNAANVNIINMNAANITSGYLNVDRIQANSITADKLAANTIQVGFNSMGNTMQLSATSLSFYSGGNLSGRLTDSGMEYWYGSRYLGRTGESVKDGNANVRGISNQLNYQGDYVTWSYKSSESASTYTTQMTLDPKGSFTGKKGIVMGTDVYLNKLFSNNATSRALELSTTTYNNTQYARLGYTGGSGLIYGANWLYMIHNGYVYDFEVYKKIHSLFKGKKIAFATSFNSNGQATSWYNVQF